MGICLSKHPRNIDVWMFAAYNEIENTKNYDKARKLFLECLKTNPGELEVYSQLFNFELLYAEISLKRKKLLIGIDDEKNPVGNFDDETPENEKNEKYKNLENDEVLNLKLPELVYQEAIKNCVNNTLENVSEEFFKVICSFSYKLDGRELNLKNLIKQNVRINENSNDTKAQIFLIECEKINLESMKEFYQEVDKKFDLFEDKSNNLFNFHTLLKGFVKYFDLSPKVDKNFYFSQLLQYTKLKKYFSNEIIIDNLHDIKCYEILQIIVKQVGIFDVYGTCN